MRDAPRKAGDLAAAWDRLRGDEAIQFAQVKVPPPAPPPDWLTKLMHALARFGETLGLAWPIFRIVLIIVAIAGAALFVWPLVAPLLDRRPPAEAEWAPDRAAALALLEDADRLAADGRFDEATRLLLQRSVGQIDAARPGMLHPASTAREIAMAPALPERARTAFAMIATRVERSLFALRGLELADWQAARAAYADFALAELA